MPDMKSKANKNRMKNKPFWVAMTSAFLLAVQSVGALFGFDLTDAMIAEYQDAVNSVLVVLVIAGVINNPTTDNDGFKDE